MGNKSLTAVDRSSSILDRASSQASSPLTEAQAGVDQLVSLSIQEGTNLKTAAAMLGAGWVGRVTRIGALTSLPGQAFARGASYVPALAAESAAFAGIERGFHPSSQPFQKDWARAAVTLTGLKAFGGLSRGQNIVLQHLFTDLGLVGGHHAAHAVGLMEKPQGNFARQMLQAEATNWQMKGSIAFAHSLSPRLSTTERSLDLYLKGQETNLFSQGRPSPIFSQLATEGGPEAFLSEGLKESNVWKITGEGENRDGSNDRGEMGIEALAKEAETSREGVDRLYVLDAVGDPRAKGILRSLVVTTHAEAAKPSEKALWTLRSLARSGNEGAKQALKDLDVSEYVQRAEGRSFEISILKDLAQIGNEDAFKALTELAKWKVTAVSALLDLAKIGHEHAEEVLKNLAVTEHVRQAEYGSAETIQTLGDLSRIGNESAFTALVTLAPDKGVAVSALLKLMEAGHPLVREVLKSFDLAKHADRAKTDKWAVSLLRDLVEVGHENAFEALVKAAESNPEAISVLQVGDARAGRALQKLNVTEHTKIAKEDPKRIWTLRDLTGAHNESAFQALVVLAQDNREAVWALLDLARNGHKSARRALKNLDVKEYVRWAHTDHGANLILQKLEVGNKRASAALDRIGIISYPVEAPSNP